MFTSGGGNEAPLTEDLTDVLTEPYGIYSCPRFKAHRNATVFRSRLATPGDPQNQQKHTLHPHLFCN